MRKTKKKKGLRHHVKRIHRHVKKHLARLKKKRPRVHKALVLMSFTVPIVLGALLFGSSALYYYESHFGFYDDSQEKITVNIPAVPDDTTKWKTYKDDLSNFSMKYPDDWPDPKIQKTAGDGEKFLRKITFDNGLDSANSLYRGFEVYIYNAQKISGPVGTDNLVPKDQTTYSQNTCDKAEFGEATFGEESYPGQEVDVGDDDACFKETYFFSLNRNDYVFNILPEIAQNKNPISEESKAQIISGFPKFFEILSTIIIPEKVKVDKPPSAAAPAKKPLPPRRVLAPLGRCPHKNDHPRKSKTKKHRHMDEDCCMDPDEWPNPRCQY